MTTKIIKKKIEAEVDDDLEKYLENSVVAFAILEEEFKNGFKEYHKNPEQLDNLLTHYRMQQKDLDNIIGRLLRKTKKEREEIINKRWIGYNPLYLQKTDGIIRGHYIGEIKKGSEIAGTIDEQAGYDFMWTTCIRCDGESWLGIKNGKLLTFRCFHCYGCSSKRKKITPGSKNYYTNASGYRVIYIHKSDPYFPMAIKKEKKNYYEKGQISARILEHRYVMAQHLGRCLESWEIVHHINGDKSDNRIENLELLQEPKEHLPSMAMQQRIKKLEKQLSAT